MSSPRRCALLASFLAFASLVLAGGPGEHPPPRGYVCYRAETAPTMDGKLDDAAWQAAPWSEEFVDIEGDKKPKPRFRTRMKMLWDDKALYIAADMDEPHLWGTLTQRDSVIFQDNDFEVFIDPDGDNHLYGELEVNAKNTVWDLLLTKPYRDGGKALNGWDIIGLKTAVALNGTLNDASDSDSGWSVEIAWPWEGLKELTGVPVPPKDGHQWRINFSRVEWDTTIEAGKYVKVKGRPEHNWVWSPQGIIDMHCPERWGYLQFSTRTKGPVKYLPDPSRGVQDFLHEIYYAQRSYHKKHGAFTKDFAKLGIKASTLGTPGIEVTRTGYTATMAPKSAGGREWTIAQDSRIWSR
jgi:hypothetical protein